MRGVEWCIPLKLIEEMNLSSAISSIADLLLESRVKLLGSSLYNRILSVNFGETVRPCESGENANLVWNKNRTANGAMEIVRYASSESVQNLNTTEGSATTIDTLKDTHRMKEVSLMQMVEKVLNELDFSNRQIQSVDCITFPFLLLDCIVSVRAIKTSDTEASVLIFVDDGLVVGRIDGIHVGRDASEQEFLQDKVIDIVKESLKRTGMKMALDPSKSLLSQGVDSLRLSDIEFSLQCAFPERRLRNGFTLKYRSLNEIIRSISSEEDNPKIPTTPSLAQCDKKATIPLTSMQSSLVYLAKMNDIQSRSFHETVQVQFENASLETFIESVRSVVMEHTILRTIYSVEAQYSLSGTECYIRLSEDTEPSFIKIFEDPPIMVVQSRDQTLEGKRALNIVFHHIAVDGRSISILADRLRALLYGGISEKVSHHYADYAFSQSRQNHKDGLDYWRNKLNNISSELLPPCKKRSVAAPSCDTIEVPVSEEILSWMQRVVVENGSTSFGVFCALYRVFVYKSAGLTDFPIGIAACQRDAESQNTVGCFVNNIVLRCELDARESFSSFLRKIYSSLSDARVHSNVPYNDVVNAVNGSGSDSSLFQVYFNVDDITSMVALSSGITFSSLPNTYAKYEQTWTFARKSESDWTLNVEYRSDLFSRSLAEQSILHMFSLALDINKKGLNTKLCDLQMITKTINQDIASKNTSDFPVIPFGKFSCGQESSRLYFGDDCISYSEMFDRAGEVGQVLRQRFLGAYGVSPRPDDCVCLYLQRSINLIPVILGAWQASFSVTTLSLDWPFQRQLSILNKMNNAVFITDGELPENSNIISMRIEELTLYLPSDSLPSRNSIAPHDILYITYTSGTTGQPKGVCSTAEGLSNLATNYTREYKIHEKSVVYQVVNYGFDIFFADIISALVNGATLVLTRDSIPDLEEIMERGVTHAYVMPAFLSIVDDKKAKLWSTLECVTYGGEPMNENNLRIFLHSGVRLHQQFGYTEQARMHINTVSNCVGKPYNNQYVFMVDPDGGVTSFDRRMALHSHGVGLARGLLCDVKRTNEKFLWNSSLCGEDRRSFDSCDIFSRINGEFYFHGRRDNLVKIRGRTIDIFEIQHCLSSLEEVISSVVGVYEVEGFMEKKNVAHLVTRGEIEDIKRKLEQVLPSFMIPDFFVKMESLPLNANGKVDIRALQLPQCGAPEIVAPPTANESGNDRRVQFVLNAFRNVLEKTVERDACFFASGGDSLRSMLVVQYLEKCHSLSIPLKRFFELRTASAIASELEPIGMPISTPLENKASIKSITSKTGKYLAGLSHQQRQLWIDQQLIPTNQSYYVNLRMSFKKVKQRELLRAVNSVVGMHSILRVNIARLAGGDTVQFPRSLTESFFSLNTKQTGQDKRKELIEIETMEHGGELSLNISVHHILIDGQSIRILAEDFMKSYEDQSYRALQPHDYLEYCKLQNQQPKIKDQFWKSYLSEFKATTYVSKLSADRNENTGVVRRVIQFDKHRMNEYLNTHGCTQFHLLAACLVSLLRSKTNQCDIVIGTPHANRNSSTMNIVGLFINMIPLRFHKANIDLIEEVKESVNSAFEYHSTPFEVIVEAVDTNRDNKNHPIFQIVLNLQNTSLNSIPPVGNMEVEVEMSPAKETNFQQSWLVTPKDGEFLVIIQYNYSLFEEGEMNKALDEFVEHFNAILHGVRSNNNESVETSNTKKAREQATDSAHLSNLVHASRYPFSEMSLDKKHINGMGLKRRCESSALRQSRNAVVSSVKILQVQCTFLQASILDAIQRSRSSDLTEQYCVRFEIGLKQSVEVYLLRDSINSLVMNNSALRAMFHNENEQYFQRRLSGTESYISTTDKQETIDVFRGPQITGELNGSILSLSFSHLTTDGHSINILAESLMKNKRSSPEPLECEGFSGWLNSKYSERRNIDEIYWRSHLANFVINPAEREIFGKKNSSDGTGRFTVCNSTLKPTMIHLAQLHSSTPFAVCLGALNYSMRSSLTSPPSPVAIGWPHNLRSAKWQNAIGMGVVTLLSVLDHCQDVEEYIRSAQDSIVSAIKHCFVSYNDLCLFTESNLLFDVMLVMDPYTITHTEEFELISPNKVHSKFPITFFVDVESGSIEVHFKQTLISHGQAMRICHEFQGTLLNWGQGTFKTMERPKDHIILNRKGTYVSLQTTADHLKALKLFKEFEWKKERNQLILYINDSITEKEAAKVLRSKLPHFLVPDSIIIRGPSQADPKKHSIVRSYPLSPAQKQMLYLYNSADGMYYNNSFVGRISNACMETLRTALHYVVQSQEALRTVVIMKNLEPSQILLSATEVYYAPNLKTVTSIQLAAQLRNGEHNRFPIIGSIPMRVYAYQTDEEHVFCIVASHLILDGWSTGILQKDLMSFYTEVKENRNARTSRRRYTHFNWAIKSADERQPEINEQRRNLIVRGRPSNPSSLINCSAEARPQYVTKLLSETFSVKLTAVCRLLKVSPFAIMLTSVARTIHERFQREAVNIQAPVANRTTETMDLIGMFMNNVVYTSQYNADAKDHLKDVSLEIARVNEENIAFPDLMNLLRSRSSIKEDNDLFDILVNGRYNLEEDKEWKGSKLLQPIPDAIFPLEVALEREESSYVLEMKMRRSKVSTATSLFEDLLRQINDLLS